MRWKNHVPTSVLESTQQLSNHQQQPIHSKQQYPPKQRLKQPFDQLTRRPQYRFVIRKEDPVVDTPQRSLEELVTSIVALEYLVRSFKLVILFKPTTVIPSSKDIVTKSLRHELLHEQEFAR